MENFDFLRSGAFIVDKNTNVTSRYVDNYFSKSLKYRKVGHLGTLDPFASGLLIVFVNEGTKLIPLFEDLDKEYVATLRLGSKTDTGDLDGTVIDKKDVPSLSKNEVKDYLASLKGENFQIPPMYSAIKKDGVPLYKLAREGKEIDREQRRFYIHDIELLELTVTTITFRVCVSKGTYIRTLGEDIAEHFGTVGYLTSLRRTRVGSFSVDNAKTIDVINNQDLHGILELFAGFDKYSITSEEEKRKVKNALPLELQFASSYVLIMSEGMPIAVYKKTDRIYSFLRGLN